MSNHSIRVENLSKRYVLNHQVGSRDGLRHSLEAAFRNPLRWLRERGRRRHEVTEEFWALKDVSLEVAQGEVVGIIGRNGAGKSTFLKILSRITEPTNGRILIDGRVASLLEVGTGFHPELTGRENIFLNGAILGMASTEIRRKFDEIVAFAGVETFLDTPVKRYSSGMYVRLAFAVAAHLDSDILIVDEVLAVGDAQFQRKCLGKMDDISKRGGRTVLIVSHQMAAIANLCTKCVVLDHGSVNFAGDTKTAISRYLSLGETGNGNRAVEAARAGWATPYITSSRLLSRRGEERDRFEMGEGLIVELRYATEDRPRITSPVMGVVIRHNTFGPVAGVNTRMTGFQTQTEDAGVFRCEIPHLPLLQGAYSIDVWLADGPSDIDMLSEFLRFTIEDSDVYGSGQVPFSNLGAIYLEPEWQFEAIK